MLLSINHPSYDEAEKTILTDPASLGATTLKVKSTKAFTAADYVVVGGLGTENAEMRAVAVVTNDISMTVDTLDFSHNEGDPVVYSLYNQIKIYRATSLTGTYSLLATVDIDVDQSVTVYNDTTSVSTYYYKVAYYNSTTTAITDLSDPIPATGVEADTVRAVTDEILKEARDEDESITSREEILSWLNDCQADVKARRRKWAFLYTRAAASTVADTEYYPLSTAFSVTNIDKIDHLVYRYDDGSNDNSYRLLYLPEEEFDYQTKNNDEDSSDALQSFTIDEAMDYIRVYPKPETTTAASLYLYYYKDLPYLDSDGDELLIPETRIYKFYCLHEFFLKKGELQLSERYSMKYEQALAGLVREQRKEVGQPRGFRYLPQRERRYYQL